MPWKLFCLIFVGIFVISNFSLASMSSTSYQIDWDSLNYGGSDTGSSVSYILRDTVGNSGAGISSSASYSNQAGYRAGIFDEYISFKILGQQTSTAKSASSLVGNTITVSDASGFTAGDYIAVVQDLGVNQVSAIGQVESTGVGTITVDFWTNNGTAPVIDGTNDYVYELGGASTDLGALSASEIKTVITGFETIIDSDAGYSIQIMEDGELRSGSNTINDVSDGTVTAGSSEYGARSSDSSLATSTFDTEDSGITSIFQDIVTESTFQYISRSFLTSKTAISSSTSSGTYAQVLTFIASANF